MPATTEAREGDLTPLFQKIVDHVPATADGRRTRPSQFLATLLDRDNFLGRILTGRVSRARQAQSADPRAR
jgi:GTP-binding protein